jgi:D-aspartate ligase
MSRHAIVFGLQTGGLALVRSLGRSGVEVSGIALEPSDLGLRSRYLAARQLVEAEGEHADAAILEHLRRAAARGPVALFPERDAHVDLLLRHWQEVRELADIPLPDDAAATIALRDKGTLPRLAAEAGLDAPTSIQLSSVDDLDNGRLHFPFLLKPLDSERYAAVFREKVAVVGDMEEAKAAWDKAAEAGFALIAQELVPGSTDRIQSLFTYIDRAGRPLGTVVGRKVRQGPPFFGSSTVFTVEPDREVLESGLRLLASVGYRGFAHVELVRDPRDRRLKLLEVNTRLPVWAGLALSRYYDLGPLAFADLAGERVEPLPPFEERVSWTYLAKDVVTAARLLRRGKIGLRSFARPYLEPHVPAVRAARDFGPTRALLRWGARRTVEKMAARLRSQ